MSFARQRAAASAQVSHLENVAARARNARVAAEAEAARLGELLDGESDRRRQEMAWARAGFDRLFGWAISEGHRTLPPLVGREQRLRRLEEDLTRWLEARRGEPGWELEEVRTRFQLAEIALARGDVRQARDWYEQAQADAGEWPAARPASLRLARFEVLLACRMQELGSEGVGAAFQNARVGLEALDEAGGHRAYLEAALDLHESMRWVKEGNEAKALDLLHRATRVLHEMADVRPESVVLRSELADAYLASAEVMDNLGELGDARSLRKLAGDQLVRLIEKQPKNVDLRLDLAGCYGAMAESALLAGDVSRARAMSEGTIELLKQVLPHRPDSVVARSRLAAQHGLMAGILQDRGKAEEALERYDRGIGLLEDAMSEESSDPLVRYRYALLLWQRGRLLGFGEDTGREVRAEDRAAALLNGLLEGPFGQRHGEKIRRSLGYLFGDLGHARQERGENKRAAEAFRQAVGNWRKLSERRPDREEYREALRWSQQRLKEVE